jgi:dehydrogenase/reductase SDR family member 7B
MTGASSGIGESLAINLAERNNTLILSARNTEKLEALKVTCEKLGSKCFVAPLDLSDGLSIENTANKVLAQFPKIDVLVNNGGISQRSLIEESGMDIDRKIMEVNYFGQVALTKKVLPGMIKNKNGQIAVTSSIVGIFGFPLRSAYSASKHALHGFFETLKIEQKQNNIRVSIFIPGRVHTHVSLNAIDKHGKAQGIMDHGQDSGMPPEKCAKKMVRGLEKEKYEVLIGGKELIMVFLRRNLKKIFFILASKIKPT